jgi:HlyD family secretion protein
MRRILYIVAVVGLIGGGVVAYVGARTPAALPPAFNPAANPYKNGIYASGILESDQASGQNINVYPEVSGTVKEIVVKEGQEVRKGDLLLQIDDSIQKATVEQLHSQSLAALSALDGLRAQPRKENLDVSEAQVLAAQAALKTAEDSYSKQKTAYDLNPRAIGKDALDSAENAVATAKANLEVAGRQRDLTKAGAWTYDIHNQERQYQAAQNSYQAANALLTKYSLRAPRDGRVLAINPTVGSYVSAQGAYDSYTQGQVPVVVLGSSETELNVRAYVDEILVPRLPASAQIKAQMTVRGSNQKFDLEYVRTQPIVSPKIELSDQRQERVDVRVLPIIFKLKPVKGANLYPGQLVDVYIGE